MALFEARDLHLRFGDRVVLENVSLSFEAGRLSGIMGPNGAGKTTCFNVLTGRYRPDRGHVTFEGVDITGRSPQAIARLGIARSFQLMNLFDEFTAFENVAVALPETRRRGHDALGRAYAKTGVVEQVRSILETVGLGERADEVARTLPYGERRALEIAVALAARPKLLFLDEPTAGLGSDGRARLAALVRRLKGQVTLVVIEHDMEFLFSLADQISVIHWGQVIAQGSPEALRENPWVRNSNLGRLA
jgi:branched-chain amino acid transport system ATP-binding protein